MAGFSWGGMAAAIPGGYLEAQKQQQQMADEMMRRKLMQQQFATTQRQAPLQDQLLRAQVQHMQRPDINAQRFAQENQAAQYGLGFMGTPGAQPMPQPPQGGVPQAFQGAQPMPGVSAGQPQGMPQGQPGMQPNPFAQAPQGQPQGQPQGMPQGQPQGQPQGMPQGQPQATDPLAAQEQQAMNALRQRVQQELPSIPPQQRAAYAMAVQQAQQQIQSQANEARKMAMEQLSQRKQQSLESWRDQMRTQKQGAEGRKMAMEQSLESRRGQMLTQKQEAATVAEAHKMAMEQLSQRKQQSLESWRGLMLTQKQGAATAAEERSERSSLTSQRDTDMRELDQARASGMISDEVYQAGKAQIEQKYSAVAPKEAMKTPGMAIPDKVYNRLVDAAKTQFGEEADPAKVVGKTIQDTDGQQYKIVEHEGKLDFEPVE